jgi:hypothetical protein
MNRDHSSKGYKVVKNTAATAANFYGFSVVSEATITTVVAPTAGTPDDTAYTGDTTGLASVVLPVGYYPIRGSSITLGGGIIILWTE